MKGALPLRIPIESFIVTPDDRDPKRVKLIYFDPKGKRHEVSFRKSAIDAALAKMDGKPKAIARSSGGLVPAQPYQLVLHHSVSESAEQPPELRIKVRFKEFVRDERGRVTSGAVMTVTKNILPEEVLDEVNYDLKSPQKFLLDAGHGALPVSVFSFVSDAAGDNQALFVDADAIERAIRAPSGSKILVQRYKIDKDLIRVVRDLESSGEILSKAKENFERLKRQGGTTVPDALKVGEPIEIPTGMSYQAIAEFLRQSAHRWNRQSTEEVTLSEYDMRDEGCVTSDFLLFMEPI
ncbi:hypothetical protein K2X33_08635 [bacterium]|nr:hypothetical protein [bacterium]